MDEAWIALRLTLKVAFVATIINMMIGVCLAYLFASKRFLGKDFLDTILTLPMVLGYYLLVFIGKNGPIGYFLKRYFDINLIFTWQGAVIAASIVSFPLVFKTARVAFESLEPQYVQSAKVLGVGDLAIFFRVTLPLAWRGILSGILLSFARSAGEFGATLMVAGSIPGKTQTLSIAVYEAVQAGQDDTANFLVLLISIVCMTILLVSGKLAPGRIASKV